MTRPKGNTRTRSARLRAIAVTALAALGLTSLSPMQQGVALLTAGAAALWASPALAQGLVPGVGQVVKKKPGNSAIIASSDANGEVRLTGLEPGTYTVQVIGGAQEAPVRVGPDGTLAFVAYEDVKRAVSPGPAPRRSVDPVARRWAEQIAAPGPCNEPITCNYPRSAIDLNTANAQDIARITGTSMQSAVQIMVQREQRGPYTSIEDFARRNCPTTVIEMSQGAVKIGSLAMILAPSTGKPIVPGFQCKPGDTMFRLYAQWHNYVGHVTLLR